MGIQIPQEGEKLRVPKKKKEPESHRIAVKRAETQTESMFLGSFWGVFVYVCV